MSVDGDQRVDALRRGAGGAGVGHLEAVLIGGVEQVLPRLGGLHVVLLEEVRVREEAERDEADAGPAVAGVSVFGGRQSLLLRRVLCEYSRVAACGVDVGGAAEEYVDLRIFLLRREAREGLARREADEVDLDSGVLSELLEDLRRVLLRHDRVGVERRRAGRRAEACDERERHDD